MFWLKLYLYKANSNPIIIKRATPPSIGNPGGGGVGGGGFGLATDVEA